jgi:hypothetical protein
MKAVLLLPLTLSLHSWTPLTLFRTGFQADANVVPQPLLRQTLVLPVSYYQHARDALWLGQRLVARLLQAPAISF